MNKINSSILSACLALSISSCENSFDINSHAEGVLAFAQEGFNTLQSYDVGEEYVVDLWIQQGGLNLSASTIEISVDESLVDSINKSDGTSYKLLPADCYKLPEEVIHTSDKERLMKKTLTYNPTKIKELSGYNHVQYILPIRAKSSGMPFIAERSTMLLGFNVSEPIVTIMNPGVEVINPSNVSELGISIGVPFTNKWEITCQLANNQSVIDDYNRVNNTYFSMLPADSYTSPDTPVLKAGISQVTATYKLKQNLLPGNYMLPVQISSISSTATIKVDKESYTAYCIIKEGEKLSKSNWKIVSATTEEPTGEGSNNGKAKHMIDDNSETFWHTKWSGGSDPLPYEIVIDMIQKVKIAQIELLPRGRGSNNPLKVVRFEASENGQNWTPIGQFGFTNQDAPLKYYVKSATARYIKLIVPDQGGNTTVAAIRELDVKGTIIE